MNGLDIYVTRGEVDIHERSYFGVTTFVFSHKTRKYYRVVFAPPAAIQAVCGTHHLDNGISYESLILVKDLRDETIKHAMQYAEEARNYLSTLLPLDNLDCSDVEYVKMGTL